MPEVTTYRYVRGSLLALLLALAVSVALETLAHGWQTSISSYYYTAAGPVFIAALSAIGVCLIALRGGTDAEDVCLNLAGISAPMVAFVPTPEIGHVPDVPAITNNAATFLGVLAVGYVVVAFRLLRRPGGVGRWNLVGLGSVALAWAVGCAWLAIDRHSFAAHAHALAAIFTFVPFAGVVVLNTDWGVRVIAREGRVSRTRFDAAYWVVLVGMGAVCLVGLALWQWRYALVATEIGVLVLFAVFWVLQTIDLLDLRRDLA